MNKTTYLQLELEIARRSIKLLGGKQSLHRKELEVRAQAIELMLNTDDYGCSDY